MFSARVVLNLVAFGGLVGARCTPVGTHTHSHHVARIGSGQKCGFYKMAIQSRMLYFKTKG